MTRQIRLGASLTVMALAVGLQGCASYPLLRTSATRVSDLLAPNHSQDLAPVADHTLGRAPELISIPGPNLAKVRPGEPEASPTQVATLFPNNSTIDANLPPQPLPQFLDTALGQILKAPYSLGPNVASRQDIITLRSGPQMSQRQFFLLLQTALRDYGLRMYIRDGSVVILDDNSPTSPLATILRSRSARDTPEGSRTVVQFFQMQTLDAINVKDLVSKLFPASRSVSLEMEQSTNTIVVSGSARDVGAVVAFLQQLDRPAFSGAQVARLQPVFWGADAYAAALDNALTAEGFKVSRSALVSRSILILSMPATNQVLVFCNDPDLMARVQFWAKEIDQSNAFGDQKTTFIYDVRNTSAQDLGALATGSSPQTTSQIAQPTGVAGTTAMGTQSTNSDNLRGTLPGGGSITIDRVGNRIMFTGTAAQFSHLRDLLEQLDKAPPQVMIEVTVAEVTLTDATRLGLEWFFTHSQNNGTFSGGTLGKLGIGATGLGINFTGTDLRAAFNAFASNNKVNIISRPRILAKSGEEAQIQVGTDIPIITSQGASNVQSGGVTNVLQTVQYRQTGVILKIKPIVYGDNRVDLEISQEISKQSSSTNSAISSPSILNRSLSTKISILEGATSVLGGLMDDNYGKANSGIPFLKDIPGVGAAFRQDTIDGTKTELVMLVTPYIVRDGDDMGDLASQLSGEMNQALRVGRGGSYTLTGVTTGISVGFAPPAG